MMTRMDKASYSIAAGTILMMLLLIGRCVGEAILKHH